MKIKLFISSSLGLAALWLVAAYFHTVDLSTYTPVSAEPVSVSLETEDTPRQDDKNSVAATQ